jgi:4-amino-4-deoxy-L-arabinose transferase-like glycosyltransferase
MRGDVAFSLRRRLWVLPVLLLLCVTLPHLEQGDFRTDTARYAAVGVQAWQGGQFWTPHLHPSVPYFNKPPLVFWIHGLFLHLFGIGLVVARLPSVLAAAGCVALTVAVARRLAGRATALSAGLILALSYEFFRRTREISLDMWQLFFLLAAIWLAATALRPGRSWRLALAGIPIGMALLCKPLTALLTIVILAVWLPLIGRTRDLRWLPVTLATALLVALPWHVSMASLHGKAFILPYFGVEILGRIKNETLAQPAWYYAAEIGRTYWPWMILLGTGLLGWYRSRASRRPRSGLLLAAAWLVVWGVALSLFPDKRPRYALPLYPMLAVLGGSGLAHLPWRPLRNWYRRSLVMIALAAFAVGVTIAALPVRFQAPPDPHWAALFTWMQEQSVRTIHEGALSTNDEGYFFLRLGWWPEPAREPRRGQRTKLPAGTLLLYLRGLEPGPGRNEAVVFTSGDILVTRLGDGGWAPVRRTK